MVPIGDCRSKILTGTSERFLSLFFSPSLHVLVVLKAKLTTCCMAIILFVKTTQTYECAYYYIHQHHQILVFVLLHLLSHKVAFSHHVTK